MNAGDWERRLTVFDEHVVVDEQLAGHIVATSGSEMGAHPAAPESSRP